MSYVARYSSSPRPVRRGVLGQALTLAEANQQVDAANAQVIAANAARQAAMIRPIALGAGALVLVIGGSWALNLLAKRAAGINGSVWSATGKQQLLYTGLSLGTIFPVALAADFMLKAMKPQA